MELGPLAKRLSTLARFTDYGSDVLSDDITPNMESAPAVASTSCASTATPRAPLKPRDANVPATPPSSHFKKSNDTCGHVSASQNAVGSYGRQVPQHQFPTLTSTFSKSPSVRHAPAYQNAPSSSQPLPTPVTGRMAPPAQYIPSSSQPTSSKKPAQVRARAVALQAQPSPTAHTPKVAGSPSDQAALYRFPFGTHRGKTLLEVPENYIAYLRVDQDMADSMPGFSTVLQRFDAGLPPGLPPAPPPPPPPASQPKLQDVPPSSAPARTLASQPPSSQEPPPSTPVSQSEYRFDFGKHIGKTLSEVPADYIDFLKQRRIVESKPALAVAVIKHERELSRSALVATSSRPEPTTFTLRFGKHKGKTIDEVPSDYVTWLKNSSDMYNES